MTIRVTINLWLILVLLTSQDGFVNSLAFAKSGKFLIAGVAQVKIILSLLTLQLV